MAIFRTLLALLALITLPTLLFAQGVDLPVWIEERSDFFRGSIVEFWGELFGGGLDNEINYQIQVDREWLSIEPSQGILGPNDVIQLTIRYDLQNLEPGNYDGGIFFFFGDDEEVDWVVWPLIRVLGRPEIQVEWDQEGFPPDADWNEVYADLFAGFPYDIVFQVENIGEERLIVERISTGTEVFTVSPDELSLEPDQATEVTVTFEAQEEGEYHDTLVFITNDPLIERVEIPLVAEATLFPIAVPIEGPIEYDLFTGEIVQHEFPIRNEGDSPLRFTIETEIIEEPQRDEASASRSLRGVTGGQPPLRDDAGDVLGSFRWQRVGAGEYKGGIAYDEDNDLLLVTDYQSGICAFLDPEDDYREVGAFGDEGSPMQATWLNGVFYVVRHRNGESKIHTYDAEGRALGIILVGEDGEGITGALGVAASPENNLLLFLDSDGPTSIGLYNPETERVVGWINDYWQWTGNRGSYGMLWIDAHEDGQLWMQIDGRYLYQLRVDIPEREITELIQRIDLGAARNADINKWDGLGHDRDNLLYGRNESEEYLIIDDGIHESYWLTVEPTEGVVEPGEEVIITVTLDATGLIGGDYVAEILIYTNDPNANPAVVEVIMHVPEPMRGLWFEWDEDFGYPDGVFFPPTFVGDADTLLVIAENTDINAYTIDAIESDNEAFRVEPDNVVIEPDEEVEFLFIFEPAEAVAYEGTISIFTDDPNNGEMTITVRGEGLEPPRFEPPEDIEFDAVVGEVEEEEFVLENSGGSDLEYAIELETEQPERDEGKRALRSVSGEQTPRRDDPGDLIAQFDGINVANEFVSPIACNFDERTIYISHYNANRVYCYRFAEDYSEIEEVVRLAVNRPMDDGWFSGQLYIITPGQTRIHRFDQNGNFLQEINMGFPPYGIAFDHHDNRMFLMQGNGPIIVYEMDGNLPGEQIGAINSWWQFNDWNQQAYALEWAGLHESKLWVTNSQTGRVYQIHVDEDRWIIDDLQQSFPALISQPWDAICHDGYNLWAGGYARDDIRVYDDGNWEVYWLTVDPDEGVIHPGETQVFTVTLDFRGAIGGDYTGVIRILTNDPEHRVVEVAIDCFVEGRWPDIPMWDEGFGWPDLIDFNGFGETYVGESYPLTITWENNGTDDMVIEEVTVSHGQFRIEPDEAIIEPGEDVEFTLTFEPQEVGEVEATLAFRLDVPEWEEEWVEIWVRGEGIEENGHHPPPRFVVTETNHSILITGITFNGEAVARGWEVGVFTPDDVLCGEAIWQQRDLGIAAFGAGEGAENQFHDGELMSFRVWDPRADREYPARPIVEDGDLHWVDNGFTVLSLEAFAEREQEILLRRGWSLISLNIIPSDRDLWSREEGPNVRRMLVSQLGSPNEEGCRILLFKDERGRFYAGIGYDWLNIPYWNLQEGYQIKVTEEVVVSWAGESIDAHADIPIAQNWNMIPYYPTYQLDASAEDFYVLSPIIDHVLLAKDDEGRFMLPRPGQIGFSNMPPWQPGKAYQIKVDADVVLRYPEERMRNAECGMPNEVQEHFKPVERTGRNMSVLVNGKWKMEDGTWEIGAFTESGLCVGAGRFQSEIRNQKSEIGLAVWGDDPSTEEIDGAVEGEALDFRLWDGKEEGSAECRVQSVELTSASASALKYETDGFAEVSIDASILHLAPSTLGLSAFPNPFNSSTRISFGLDRPSSVRISVNDLEGREIAVLTDKTVYPAGQHSVVWDGSAQPAGVYFIVLNAGGERKTAKLTLLK